MVTSYCLEHKHTADLLLYVDYLSGR